MKIVSHSVGTNDIEFAFDDGYSLFLNGRKQCAAYGGSFEIFGGVRICRSRYMVARYSPEDSNPKMKLASGWTRESFMTRWDAASEYFEKNRSSLAAMCGRRDVMSETDLTFLEVRFERSRQSARDGRRTKTGSL